MHNLAPKTPQPVDLRPSNVIEASSGHNQHITRILKHLFVVQVFDFDRPFRGLLVPRAGLDFVAQLDEAVDAVLADGGSEVCLDFTGRRVEGRPVWVWVEGILVGMCCLRSVSVSPLLLSKTQIQTKDKA